MAKAKAADEPLPVWEKDNNFSYFKLSERRLGSRLAVIKEYEHCYFCDRDYSGYESDDDNHDRSLLCPEERCIREAWLVPAGEYWEKRMMIEIRFFHHPNCPFPFDDPDKYKKRCDVFQMESKPKSKPAGFSAVHRAA